MYRLIGSLLVGLAFALLTWLMIGDYPHPHAHPHLTGIGFEYIGEVIMILLLPGMVTGVMVSGNIHVTSVWVAALGNFVFYFGVVYLVLVSWEKRKAKHHGVMPPTPTDGSSTTPR